MKQLESIQTPTGKISLFQDNDNKLWIQQNELTVALGYNKFLSRNKKRGSGLGKFLSGNIVKKYGNRNLLDLKKIVELVLPEFLKGFFRELNGHPSRKQFFNKAPEEIYHNSKRVLEILKEKLMSYDPNSIEAKKGALGEKIVENELKRHHANPRRPADTFQSGASIVDFAGTDGDGKTFFAEVKTQIAKPYGVENAPCYSFPKSKINAYIEYGKKHGAPVDMFVVDPSTGFGYLAMLDTLERETMIDGRKYPFDKYITL